MRVLLIGHSHVRCFKSACDVNAWHNAKTVDLLESDCESDDLAGVCDFALSRSANFNPDAVCLLLRGNRHNVLGIFENPAPFSIGEKTHGAVPRNSENRQFIPHALIRDAFDHWLDKQLIKLLYEAFPNARRAYISPPPPLADFEHIKRHPDIFRSKLAHGPAPDMLRTLLYRTEVEITQMAAEAEGAIFIAPPPQIFDAAGFLMPDLYSADPTHANATYGAIMLVHIFDQLREAK